MGDVRLGDVIDVKHGFAFPGDYFSEDLRFPILVTPGNIAIGGGFQAAKPKTFVGEYPSEFLLSPGDLVVSMTDLSKEGATLGLPAMIPRDGNFLHNQRIGLVRVTDRSRADKKFLSYFLRTAAYRAHVLGTASGSTVRHTSPGRIRDFVADLPPISEQQAIAEVLGALDDKIAANDQVCSLLDELGGVAVRSAAADGPLVNLRDVLTLHYGKSLPAAERVVGDVVVIGSGGPVGRHDTALVNRPGIVLGRKGTVGAVHWVEGPHFPIDTTYFVEPHGGVSLEILYYLLKSSSLSELNSDSAVPGLNRQEAYAQRIRLSTESRANRLVADLRSRFEMMATLRRETSVLAVARDELLPLLMSGKVRVKDAEKAVEDVV